MSFAFGYPLRLGLALLMLLSVVRAAPADEFASAYREINLKKQCVFQAESDGQQGGWRCSGYRGVGVEIGTQDARTHLSFGPKPWEERAAQETLLRPNKFDGSLIEWRLDGERRPFAAITLWKIQRPSDRPFEPYTGAILVVTRLGPGGVCHVGYVDARVNFRADALAREIADRSARAFQCGKDRAIIAGKREPGFDFVTP
ncbi:MAG: hypothetical protein WAK01_14270 [Methylocystis sp.]